MKTVVKDLVRKSLFAAGVMLAVLLPGSLIGAETPSASAGGNALAGSKASTADEAIADWEARWELAQLLQSLKRYDESLAEYDKVLSEKPDLLLVRLDRARLLKAMGRTEDALKETAAAEIKVKDTDCAAKARIAEVYASAGNYEKAEALYEEILKLAPEDLQVRLAYANTLSWHKRYAESIAEYRKILDKTPDDKQVRRRLSRVLMWAGKNEEAASELQKTLP